MTIKQEIKEWERIWGLDISLGAKEDLIKRIKIILEEKEQWK